MFIKRLSFLRFLMIVFLVFAIIIVFLLYLQNKYYNNKPSITLKRLELITNNAFGDGNTYVPNGWGIHKNRIVRTNSGDIFVVYLAVGSGKTNREWILMHRASNGMWTQINQGNAGTEPINMVRGPNDDLNLFAWPGTNGTLQNIYSTDLGKTFTTTSVPGRWTTSQGYSGSGINDKGNMVIFQSGDDKPGNFYWAYYTPSSNQWQFHTSTFDYRYTYAFFLPGNNNDLTIVGMRDVLRPELGYPSSEGFNYIFNAIKYFYVEDINNPKLRQLLVSQVTPKNNFDYDITYLCDTYADTNGRIHILYDNLYEGMHHLIIQDGAIKKDIRIDIGNSIKMRIVQDTTGRFYIIAVDNNALKVYPGSREDTDGTQLDPVVSLNISQHPGCTDYDFCMSPTLTVPRNGHALQDYVDGVYGNFAKVIYFRVQLRNDSPVSLRQLLTNPIPIQLKLFTSLLEIWEGNISERGSKRRNFRLKTTSYPLSRSARALRCIHPC
jgi:hypothetical protein